MNKHSVNKLVFPKNEGHEKATKVPWENHEKATKKPLKRPEQTLFFQQFLFVNKLAFPINYCWHQKHDIQKIIFWGINLCNVIGYTYIMKSSRELICVM